MAIGNQFVIQGGDCAETFKDFNTSLIKSKLKILLQMSAIIEFTSSMKVINIGRIAGQYFKPRSSLFETRGDIALPAYQGDGINSIDFNNSKRMPNPDNLIKAYHHSAATMNLIRTLIMTGFTKIYCFGNNRSIFSDDGINQINMEVLVGDGNRQWLEPRYYTKFKPIAKISKIIPEEPYQNKNLLLAAIIFSTGVLFNGTPDL